MLLAIILILSTILVTIFKVKKPLDLAISIILSGFTLIILISFVVTNNDNLRGVFYIIIFYIFIIIFIIANQKNKNRSKDNDKNYKNYSKIILVPAFLIAAGMFFLINDSYKKFHQEKQAMISDLQQNFFDKNNEEYAFDKTKINPKIANNEFFKISNEVIIISCLSFILLV